MTDPAQTSALDGAAPPSVIHIARAAVVAAELLLGARGRPDAVAHLIRRAVREGWAARQFADLGRAGVFALVQLRGAAGGLVGYVVVQVAGTPDTVRASNTISAQKFQRFAKAASRGGEAA